MNRQFIKGKNIITPTDIISGYLVIEDGRIAQVHAGELPVGTKSSFDAGNQYISPGFIDIHTHGAGGHDFMDGTVECIIEGAKEHLKHGTTSIVPTTLTSTMEELFQTIDQFKMAKRQMIQGPCLIGLHLEGPYFAMEQKGAQDGKYIKNPQEEEYHKIIEYADGAIVRWSAAPELEGAMKLGDYLMKQKIVASIGHSNAEYVHVKEAFAHGYRLITHFYCAMSSIVRRGGFRHLGIIESGYLIDDMDVEIIADGCHLPPELLRLIFKGKGPEHIILVTDSMRGAGMPDGESILGSLKRGQKVLIEDGVAKLCDKSAFAGSVATADRLVRVMTQQVGIELREAVNMITVNPARVMGLAKKGSIKEGMDADLIMFDDNIQICAAMVGGQFLFCNSGEHTDS